MGDVEDDRSASPPLPKGSYNLNFDEFDDSMDPFKSKGGLCNSPDKIMGNPFQTKTKMASSPPLPSHMPVSENNIEDVNPFVTKTKLGSSPPQHSDMSVTDDNTSEDKSVHNDSADSYKTAVDESPVKSNKGLKTRAKSQTPPSVDGITADESRNGESVEETPPVVEPVKKSPPKKIASPKKSGMKKPKARSKFKPPANFGVKNTEEDIIFAPPPPSHTEVDTAEQLEETDDKSGVIGAINNGPLILDNTTDLPNPEPMLEEVGGVSDMIDSVHDFGAGDMPIENNEGFVPASEAFNEDEEAWDMMEKMNNEDHIPAGRESLCAFDPLSEEQVPDKVTSSVPEPRADDHSVGDNDDLLLMNTPPQVKTSGTSRGVARHPAARALQGQVDGDGTPREAHIVDKMLFSPVKGEELKQAGEMLGEKYFDALEYPAGSRRAQQGDSEVERMNTANKKHGPGAGEINQDSIVQLVQVLKYSQSDWNKMKQELELDYNARILNKEREWSKKLADRDKKISYLDDQLHLLRSSNEEMKCVVSEFEKLISQLQAEKEKSSTESQQSYGDLVKERDQALEDLQSVETAFSDLHQRYERTKGVVEGFKKNEDVLKKCVQDYQVKLKAAEDKIVSVRQQAEDKLDQASQEMDKLRKSTTSEVARLDAALKKSELKIQGLDRNLEQKIKENDELTAICDELIAKVGGE